MQGISFSYFTAADVVRHKLVARIIQAYDREDTAVAAARVDGGGSVGGWAGEGRGDYPPRRGPPSRSVERG